MATVYGITAHRVFPVDGALWPVYLVPALCAELIICNRILSAGIKPSPMSGSEGG